MTPPENNDSPPEWLNNSFFGKALRTKFNRDDLEVLEADISRATVAGDHYASKMFRCKLTIKDGKDGKGREKMSVIVKAIPDGVMGVELRKFSAFEKEAEMLTKVLPALMEILREVYPEEENLGADCYHHEGPPNNLMVMEDLRDKGFVLSSRFEGMDMDESRLVLKSLGKLHAASLVLMEKWTPEAFDLFKIQVWSRKNGEMISQFFGSTFGFLAEDVLNWKDLEKRELYSRKLKLLKEEAVDKVLEATEVKEGDFRVLVHGDAWVNNFMFRYDSTGKPVEMKFVDFQLSTISSPAIDLNYLIFSSTRKELKFSEIDEFLRIYHESFEETLKRLGHRLKAPYGLDQLKKDFEEKLLWGLIIFCTIFPLFKIPSNETVDADELTRLENKTLHQIFCRDDLRLVLAQGFAYFEEKGVF